MPQYLPLVSEAPLRVNRCENEYPRSILPISGGRLPLVSLPAMSQNQYKDSSELSEHTQHSW